MIRAASGCLMISALVGCSIEALKGDHTNTGTAMTGAGGSGSGGTGASGSGGTGPSSDASTPRPDDAAPPIGDGAAPDDSEIYDPERIPRFDITLPQTSVDALDALTGSTDPKQDIYVHGSFKYGTEMLADVGVRIKAQTSFRTLDKKTPFTIKFNEFVGNQTFRGLEHLTLNNMVEDPSFLAERMAFYLFRAAKLPAPRCNNAVVYVNGAFYGLYANVEAEDRPFLRRWFAKEGGNLYESAQKDFVPGAESSFGLETNESANDRTDLANLIAVFQSTRPATFLADLDKALDTQQFLRFTAAEAVVDQWNMYAYTVFAPNNFRVYHDPTSNKFAFLPWGMELSMKPYKDTKKPHIKIFELARSRDRATGDVTAGLMFQRCLESATCKTTYTAAVRDILAVYEAAGLEAVATHYYEQIKSQIGVDPRKEISTQAIETGYQALLTSIRERPAAIRADLGL